MKIRFEGKIFLIPDACPVDGPWRRNLRRHLQEHGIEGLLTSKKLSAFSGCVVDDLVKEGAEILGPTIRAGQQDASESNPAGEPGAMRSSALPDWRLLTGVQRRALVGHLSRLGLRLGRWKRPTRNLPA